MVEQLFVNIISLTFFLKALDEISKFGNINDLFQRGHEGAGAFFTETQVFLQCMVARIQNSQSASFEV